MPGLRELEHLDGAGRGGSSGGEEAEAGAWSGCGGDAGQRNPRRDHGAPRHRHRRAGPGAGRRRGGRLPGAGGRRPRHRQIHAADPAVRQHGPGWRLRALRVRRGIGPPGQAAGATAGLRGFGLLRAVRKRYEHRGKAHAAALPRRHGGGFHPDHVPARHGQRAGQRFPGAGVRRAADAACEGQRVQRVPGGPRDQGRLHRRSTHTGAHGGRCAVLRGRPAASVPAAAGREEPIWLRQRAGYVRDERARHAGGRERQRGAAVRAGPRRQRRCGDVRHGGLPPAADGRAGPGGHHRIRQPPAHGQRRGSGTSGAAAGGAGEARGT